jgi:uncharacterized membrane protein YgdD (TMEM256/DUF423 family)
MKPLHHNNILLASGIFLFLGLGLGAIGAHALKTSLPTQSMETFMTGVTYNLIHALQLGVIGVLYSIFISHTYPLPEISHAHRVTYLKKVMTLKISAYALIIGILFFSGNCYLYALTKIKVFALMVPIGGISFMVGHLFFVLTFFNFKGNNQKH